jgi:hypothetical protein
MNTQVPHRAQDKSIERRFRRWINNKRISVNGYYLPFARQIVTHLAERTLLVALDSNPVARECQVLMVGIVYHKRLLPLAWTVYRGKKGHAEARTHIAVLEALQALIPDETNVVLVGDGEYEAVKLLTWV